jgi:hypothetical protein
MFDRLQSRPEQMPRRGRQKFLILRRAETGQLVRGDRATTRFIPQDAVQSRVDRQADGAGQANSGNDNFRRQIF